MHQEQTASNTPNTHGPVDTGDIEQRIVQQEAAIQAIKQRLSAASGPRDHFSFETLRNELALEAELATACDARGALLYDRNLARATH